MTQLEDLDAGPLATVQEQLTNAAAHLRASDKRLAQLLGTSLASIRRWRDGSAIPSPAQAEAINALCNGAGRIVGDPAPVFASTGIRPVTRDLSAAVLSVRPEPGPPLLDRLLDGEWFQTSAAPKISDLLERHAVAAPIASRPPSSGMSAGKNTYTYDAHTYHTKVPPQGIAEIIKHYLPEGGLVLDPFGGSGMTGVAASVLGSDCILNELSPAAAFIANRFVARVPGEVFAAAIDHVLNEVDALRRTLYHTDCRECGASVELLYMVWSYRVLCSDCNQEFQLWDVCRKYGRTVREHKILSEFDCPKCGIRLKKSRLARTVAEPVMIGYKCCGSRQREVNHPPSQADLNLVERIRTEYQPLSGYIPEVDLPDGVNLNQPKRHGLDTVRSFYTARAQVALSHIWKELHRFEDPEIAGEVAFAFTSLYRRVTRLSEFRFWGGSGNAARWNVPHIYEESNVFLTFDRKARTIRDHLETTAQEYKGDVAVHLGSATDLDWLRDESVDLVFTDPPFGANINYSDMNVLWEAWLGRFTDTTDEAIINRAQGKAVDDYAALMKRSVREMYRVLRPGHWMLMVFMNSSASVWEALRDAIQAAGFLLVSADVFDKQHGTFKQFVSENTPGADLVLHCLKPTVDTSVNRHTLDVSEDLDTFLEARDIKLYRQEFLHVDRDVETDYRKLYSDWLCSAVLKGLPAIDFAAFRARVVSFLAGANVDHP